MRFHYLLILLLLTNFNSVAQMLTLSGKVVDKETKEPIVFATIGIKEKSIGTLTNLQGEFDFHIPGSLRNNFLIIHMLGYKSFEAPVWSLLDVDTLIIEMEKSVTMLDEVIISDSLSGDDILQIALSRIELNYPMEPYMMDGFYRDLKRVAGTYISLLEAAVKIYDEDYKKPRNKSKLHERVALQEVRRSIGYGSRFTDYFDHDNLLEVLLLHNSVRYRLFPEDVAFYKNLVRTKDSYYDGSDVYVIIHQPNDAFIFTAYIEKSSYAIIHLEYTEKASINLGRKRGLTSKLVETRRVNDFKKYNGKYYVNYMSLDSKVNWYDVDTDKLKFETELNQTLLINEIFPNTTERIPARKKMKTYGLQFQDPPYNKEFWDNYNTIKLSPLDKKIIDDLEKEGPLETQFINN